MDARLRDGVTTPPQSERFRVKAGKTKGLTCNCSYFRLLLNLLSQYQLFLILGHIKIL